MICWSQEPWNSRRCRKTAHLAGGSRLCSVSGIGPRGWDPGESENGCLLFGTKPLFSGPGGRNSLPTGKSLDRRQAKRCSVCRKCRNPSDVPPQRLRIRREPDRGDAEAGYAGRTRCPMTGRGRPCPGFLRKADSREKSIGWGTGGSRIGSGGRTGPGSSERDETGYGKGHESIPCPA